MAITWDEIKVRFEWVSKKDVYIYASLFLLLLLLGALLNDLVHLTISEKTQNTTYQLTMALLVIHDVAFYLGLLGFIYTTQAAGKTVKMAVLALFAIVGNFVVFVFRMALEIAFVKCRVEYYRIASESGK